jgi:integrase
MVICREGTGRYLHGHRPDTMKKARTSKRASRRALQARQTRRLVDSEVKRLPLPARGNRIHYDADVPGFGVRITVGGSRSFILNYTTRGGRERRYTIGRFPDWGTADARARARELRRLIDNGEDPLASIAAEREAPTVADLIKRFEAEHLPRLRASSQADYLRMIENHIRPHFGRHTKVADVRFEDIDRLHRRISAAGYLHRANRVTAVVSKMFSLAVRWHMRPDNPVKGIERNAEHPRYRYLKGDELIRLTQALTQYPDQQAANVIRILLLTGCRKGEGLSLRWADADLATGVWSKPASSTKQNRLHETPLSAPARQLLSEIRDAQISKNPRRPLGEYVFPGSGESGHLGNLKRPWRQLCKAAGITGLRIHDLRHSFASQLVSGGASLPLIGALLGHSNPTTTHRYAHLFDDPQRAAAEKVGAVIMAAGTPAKEPTPLKRHGR